MAKHEMRVLKTSDIFKMSKILKKMNLQMEIKEDTTQTAAGVQFIQKIAENIHMAEEEVNEFLGGLVGITKEEFSDLEIEETMEIIEMFKKQKGLTGFFKLAGK